MCICVVQSLRPSEIKHINQISHSVTKLDVFLCVCVCLCSYFSRLNWYWSKINSFEIFYSIFFGISSKRKLKHKIKRREKDICLLACFIAPYAWKGSCCNGKNKKYYIPKTNFHAKRSLKRSIFKTCLVNYKWLGLVDATKFSTRNMFFFLNYPNL